MQLKEGKLEQGNRLAFIRIFFVYFRHVLTFGLEHCGLDRRFPVVAYKLSNKSKVLDFLCAAAVASVQPGAGDNPPAAKDGMEGPKAMQIISYFEIWDSMFIIR